MKKGGIGVGSSSIVLVFAVLCLTVFSLITFVVAGNDKALVDAEANLVKGYYAADALAEHIVAELAQSDTIPDKILGVDIGVGYDMASGADTAYFRCAISDQKELYVLLAMNGDSYDILSWRMLDTDEWVADDNINVWEGPDSLDSLDIGDPMDVWSGLDQWEDEEP